MRNLSLAKYATLSQHTNAVWSLSSFSYNKTLLSGSLDGCAFFWSLESNATVGSVINPGEKFSEIYATTPMIDSDKLLIGKKNGSVSIWKQTDNAQSQFVGTMNQHEKSIYSLLNINSCKFISHSADKNFKLCDIETMSCIYSFTNASPYVSTLVSLPMTSHFVSENNNHEIGIWDYRIRDCVSTFGGHGSTIHMRALTALPSENEYLLATGGNDFHIRLWDLRTHGCIKKMSAHTNYVNALVPIREHELASVAGDCSIKIWDTRDGSCSFTMPDAHSSWIQALHYYVDGNSEFLFTGSGDNTIGIWKIRNNRSNTLSANVFDRSNIVTLIPNIPSADLVILRELGRGGFGVVCESYWQGMTKVAVKQLSSQHLPEDVLREFKREAEIHGRLRHPNIVNLYGICLEQTKYALVMELMENGSLYNILHNQGKLLPWLQRINISIQITTGLMFLHAQGILHRDLKSLNVLLDHNMQAKLSDFGLSKVKTNTTTATARPVGSLYWMAPELLLNIEGSYNLTTDIYALGMIFWEIASRKMPYETASGNQTVIHNWVCTGQREKIPQDTPEGFSQIIARCWAQRAGDRPSSANIIGDELSEEKNKLESVLSVSKPSELASTNEIFSGYQLYSSK